MVTIGWICLVISNLGLQRTSDISIISAQRYESKDPLLVIEAKRLPTPGHGRTREYVQGNLGGIERFKRGFHGAGLKKSVILGYIEKENFDYWYREICSWINELIETNEDATITWDENDVLKFNTTLESINKYYSKNTRQNLSPIEIWHYWTYLN